MWYSFSNNRYYQRLIKRKIVSRVCIKTKTMHENTLLLNKQEGRKIQQKVISEGIGIDGGSF